MDNCIQQIKNPAFCTCTTNTNIQTPSCVDSYRQRLSFYPETTVACPAIPGNQWSTVVSQYPQRVNWSFIRQQLKTTQWVSAKKRHLQAEAAVAENNDQSKIFY